MLENFLSSVLANESSDIKELKQAFLPIFKHNFIEKISKEQKEATGNDYFILTF